MKSKRVHVESTNGHQDSRIRPGKIIDDKLRTARDKITRVFRYLEALNQHRNPVQRQISFQPWSLWLHDLPSHSCIERGITRPDSVTVNKAGAKVQSIDKPGRQEFVFKVRRPC